MQARPTTGVVWKVVFLTTTGFWCCAQQGILSAVLQHSFRFIWRDDFHVGQNQSGLNPTLQAAGIRHVWNCAPGGARSSRNRIFAALIPHVRDAPYLNSLRLCCEGLEEKFLERGAPAPLLVRLIDDFRVVQSLA